MSAISAQPETSQLKTSYLYGENWLIIKKPNTTCAALRRPQATYIYFAYHRISKHLVMADSIKLLGRRMRDVI